ncbi:hypothetical protein ACFQZ2_01730 [Streptomonospora algeriensis]|uniref:HTH cro/C1-type domain-containing protein n=1 Tax=Streptomonospora algeriensis TaxID=995084 RepID=A0ABW3BCJ0_9ACTN
MTWNDDYCLSDGTNFRQWGNIGAMPAELYGVAMPPAPDHERLGRYIEQRIDALGLEYKEVADAARISVETLARIRRGRPVASRTYRKLEPALGWSTYSIDHVLEGSEPAPLPPSEDAKERASNLVHGTSARGSRVTYAALDEKIRDLSPQEQQEMIDYLAEIAELHRRRHKDSGG